MEADLMAIRLATSQPPNELIVVGDLETLPRTRYDEQR
jgi:hypothetical protein